ncbi:hypothetical protein Lqui_1135 [Legionella quinlivanii]|uniref:DUF1415 domain-containing protein n=1 Tax=Legionella quinlivanii TaxID=45073 RepID=A0A0W0Y6X8_9GAMM|nr:DUF1415 domain-containing protein [Legionella quinlivanii]KTD52291.1 hypothetical protein Lqui_1135 [Legionella quinlivanii]SEF73401.1 hypothetical protein SAMN02746093_00915 [Legionella quinlivanii DSM 21216]STY12209.1 Protein of uncharacterised function (DUF1415) [Legionella quinlivanii]
MSSSPDLIVENTKRWIETFIIPLNLCPFAKREMKKQTVRFQIVEVDNMAEALQCLLDELHLLETKQMIETSFLIFPQQFEDFFHYLELLERGELLIQQEELEGIFQLASFHPDYYFSDTSSDDVTNFTNRSPYPMLHILREESLEKAIDGYGDTESIPVNNIRLLRKLGLDTVKKIIDGSEVFKKME